LNYVQGQALRVWRGGQDRKERTEAFWDVRGVGKGFGKGVWERGLGCFVQEGKGKPLKVKKGPDPSGSRPSSIRAF
jgi:hypothetical protein